MKNFALLVLLALAAYGADASAEHLPAQTASYSAHAVFDIDGQHYSTTLMADHGRERRVIETDYGPQTLLIDPAKGKGYLVQSAFGTFAIDLSSPAAGIDLARLYGSDARPMAHETLAGVAVTKYHLTAKPALNTSFTGDVWSTEDGILVKLEGVGAFHGRPSRIAMRLTDLQRGPQNQAAFELPRGEPVIDGNPLVRQMLDSAE